MSAGLSISRESLTYRPAGMPQARREGLATLRWLAASIIVAIALQIGVPALVISVKDHQAFAAYVRQTEQLNSLREKSGQPALPVMSFTQWRGN